MDPIWQKIKELVAQGEDSLGFTYGKLWHLGGIEVAVADKRWLLLPDCPWTQKDTAMVEYTFAKLMRDLNDWRGNRYCIYGAAVEFAELHPEFDIYFEGELL